MITTTSELDHPNEVVQTNHTTPPDIINIRVGDLDGNRPFDKLDALISQG